MTAAAAFLVLVVLAIAYVANDPGSSSTSTSSSSAPAAPTTTPLGCAPDHSLHSIFDCTDGALASRLCDMTLGSPDFFDVPGEVVYPGPPGLRAWDTANNSGITFGCENASEGRSHVMTFTHAQWDVLTSAGSDTPQVDALLGDQPS